MLCNADKIAVLSRKKKYIVLFFIKWPKEGKLNRRTEGRGEWVNGDFRVSASASMLLTWERSVASSRKRRV